MSTTDYSSKPRAVETGKVIPGRIGWAGLLGVAASVAANLIVRVILFALVTLPAEFPPLQPPAIAVFTFFGTILAVMVFAVVVRLSRTPIRTFRFIAVIALVVSLLPNFFLMANPSAAPFPGGSALAFGVLCLFHGIAAFVCVTILTTLSKKKITQNEVLR